jgi:hypothetical protein
VALHTTISLVHSNLTAWESRGSQEPGVLIIQGICEHGSRVGSSMSSRVGEGTSRGVKVTGQLQKIVLHRLDEARPWALD